MLRSVRWSVSSALAAIEKPPASISCFRLASPARVSKTSSSTGAPDSRRGDQAMAVARVRRVVGIIAGDPHEQARVGRGEFHRAPRRPDILVVIVDAQIGVPAEPVVAQPRSGDADLQHGADRGRQADDAIGLIVRAIAGLEAHFGRVGQSPGNVFHRAADGVATVERALRPAEHLDPVDIRYRAPQPADG